MSANPIPQTPAEVLLNSAGCPKKSVNKEISITYELMNIVQGLHMFRHM